jgi:hypothetical protein
MADKTFKELSCKTAALLVNSGLVHPDPMFLALLIAAAMVAHLHRLRGLMAQSVIPIIARN